MLRPLGQTWQQRPDIVTRVFNLKLKAFIDEMVKAGVLGETEAYIAVIEFQKRGLPHAHLVFWLNNNSKIDTVAKMNAVVCAEIPDKNKNPRLYEIVKERMIHGPCESTDFECRFDDNSNRCACKKNFPKELVENTILNEEGVSTYRRRRTANIRVSNKYSSDVDNRWVVPFNPYLLLRFNAHINVEIANGDASIKYLFKYCYKGSDSANIELIKAAPKNKEGATHVYDEMKWHQMMRYVGSTEGCWRIFDFKMHYRSHSVLALNIHLPDCQSIIFTLPLSEADIEKARLRRTHLLAWFELNKSDTNARELKITDLCEHYWFENYENSWLPRKRVHGKQLSRLQNISPRQDQLYFLRTLLLHVTGAQSFEDIRTYKNIEYETFKDACVARGLLRDDQEWMRCMEEASEFSMPIQLRNLFVMICVCQNPLNAKAILDKFSKPMSEDFERLTANQKLIDNLLFDSLAQIFERYDADHVRFGIPIADRELLNASPFLNSAYMINTSLLSAAQHASLAKEFQDKLNTEQQIIFSSIMIDVSDMDEPRDKCSFIDGPGGCGKTFLFKALLHTCRAQELVVVSVAWTGMAAELIDGGRTAHSTFRLPFNLHEDSIARVNSNSKQGQLLQKARLILWDEASQVPVTAYSCVNRLLQDLAVDHRRKKILFGGTAFTLCGDFRQTTPIAISGSQLDTLALCLCFHALWIHFKKFHLTQNMRADADAIEYKDHLLKIGNGELPVVEDFYGVVLDPRMVMPPGESLIEWVFVGNLEPEQIRAERRAILTPLNESCFRLNDLILDMVPGETVSYMSADQLLDIDYNSPHEDKFVTEETLNKETPTGMPRHHLRLKVNAVIMLIMNIDPLQGLSNGTRLLVLDLKEHVIVAEILGGNYAGKKVFLTRVDIDNSKSVSGCAYKFSRRQFPVRLAYAITITKSQGQTFDRVGLFFEDACFGHGQLYVGSSRTRNFNSIRVQVKPNRHQGPYKNGFTYTQNVVYLDLLARAGII